MATARSCSMSGGARPIEASSSVTAMRRFRGSAPLIGRIGLEIQPDGERARMRLEALRLGQRHCCRRKPAERLGRRAEQRAPLHEIEHRKTGGEARRTGRWQHVIGTCYVIAESLGGVAPDENRAGVADTPNERLRIG